MKIYKDFQLEKYNTFRVAANAREFVFIESESELLSAADELLFFEDYFILGGGSNVLFASNFEGVILKYAPKDIKIIDENAENVIIEAQAGADWDSFVRFAAERGLSGAENLAAIPGTVGAAPVQNIGAYGVEQRDIFVSLDFFDIKDGSMKTMDADDCGFGYRDSVFKRELAGKGIVVKVRYRLSKKFEPNAAYPDLTARFAERPPESPMEVYRAVSEIRAAKLPNPAVQGNAGSFFKNPIVSPELYEKIRVLIPGIRTFPIENSDKVKLPAAALIEHVGYKGAKRGAAGVSDRHALVLVNRGGASGMEIALFAERVIRKVKKECGVLLEPEVLIKR